MQAGLQALLGPLQTQAVDDVRQWWHPELQDVDTCTALPVPTWDVLGDLRDLEDLGDLGKDKEGWHELED